MKASLALVAAGSLAALGVVLAGAAGSATKPPLTPHVVKPMPGVIGDPVAPIYGHVVLVTGPHGVEKLWFAANHTFQWQGPAGERGHGTWTVQGSRICLMAMTEADEKGHARERSSPAPARCAPFASHKAGDDWEQGNDKGERIHVHVG
jgi:hypothetical protein